MIAPSNLEKASAVLQSIADRDPDAADKYFHAANYTGHNPDMADGVEGWQEYIRRLPRGSRLQVVRAFEDGPYVFTQADGQIANQNTFFDVFRFEDGLIVEHWTFSAPAGPPNQSGHTQVDGPTEAKDLEDTGKNKAFLRGY